MTTDRPPAHRVTSFLAGLVEAGAFLTAGATVAGFFGGLAWWLDLFAHFRMQYAASLLVAVATLTLAKRRAAAVVSGAAFVVNAAVLLPLWWPAEPSAARPVGTPLRVMTVNALISNSEHDRVLAHIRASQADVVFLAELGPNLAARLPELAADYPHQHLEPQGDAFGAGLLSRRPWTSVEAWRLTPEQLPTLVATFPLNDGPLTVVGVHPLPPSSASAAADRDATLAALAAKFAALAGPVVCLGDFNATRWSAPFRTFLRRTSLRDSASGHGWQPTWMADSFVFALAIDHVLVPATARVSRHEVGPDIGSDHRSVTVDVAF